MIQASGKLNCYAVNLHYYAKCLTEYGAYISVAKSKLPKAFRKTLFAKYRFLVTGHLDDCTCDVETIDAFNNYKLFPRLNELLGSDYFRYYKVNLQKPCPFWNDNSHCGVRDCAVKPCPSDKVPDGIRSASYKYSEEANNLAEECEEAKRLGAVDGSLSEETQQAVLQWTRHDDSSDSFCEADDIYSPDAEYVDLLLNPERYTGYKGPDAWKIWNSIYEENCFKPQNVKRPLASGRVSSQGRRFTSG
ncbi:endoplasmic reticulum oxidoreductase alpha [Columba livia]|uniref:ERO1-like protein alpha n=1 Tax=Columba livia TaxID=8932 RepID=A0A2I0MNG6_COLLI|nr:endoplasmic reticulum oxidoreductase alpha [Columba livia]